MLFVAYGLFLDENDIFTIISQRSKLHQLEAKTDEYRGKYTETKTTLDKLKYISEVERFARENKFFKKDDEDVFVIFYE
jgi:hypothetical protein